MLANSHYCGHTCRTTCGLCFSSLPHRYTRAHMHKRENAHVRARTLAHIHTLRRHLLFFHLQADLVQKTRKRKQNAKKHSYYFKTPGVENYAVLHCAHCISGPGPRQRWLQNIFADKENRRCMSPIANLQTILSWHQQYHITYITCNYLPTQTTLLFIILLLTNCYLSHR